MATVLGKSTASSVKVMKDPVPQFRAAGHQIAGVQNESADYSIRQDVHITGMPSTPEHLKKFRKSHVNQPGTIQKHPGLADDPSRFAANYSYGKPSYESEHVDHLIKAQNTAGLADKFNDIKEAKY